jgi:hypothetical protein
VDSGTAVCHTNGAQVCKDECHDGFYLNGEICEDIEECANPDLNICDSNSDCVERSGRTPSNDNRGYDCECHTYFSGDGLVGAAYTGCESIKNFVAATVAVSTEMSCADGAKVEQNLRDETHLFDQATDSPDEVTRTALSCDEANDRATLIFNVSVPHGTVMSVDAATLEGIALRAVKKTATTLQLDTGSSSAVHDDSDTALNPCNPNPCNSGTCEKSSTDGGFVLDTFKCTCDAKYTGATCESCVDAAFISDPSGALNSYIADNEVSFISVCSVDSDHSVDWNAVEYYKRAVLWNCDGWGKTSHRRSEHLALVRDSVTGCGSYESEFTAFRDQWANDMNEGDSSTNTAVNLYEAVLSAISTSNGFSAADEGHAQARITAIPAEWNDNNAMQAYCAARYTEGSEHNHLDTTQFDERTRVSRVNSADQDQESSDWETVKTIYTLCSYNSADGKEDPVKAYETFKGNFGYADNTERR